MSKIIEALEKAKKDGHLEQTTGALQERDTLAPVSADVSIDVLPEKRPGKTKRNASHLLSTRTLDPEILRNIDTHIETLHKPMSVVSEQYRSLRNRIERQTFSEPVQTIAVTSAIKSEGKSITAANLAVVLAQDATKNILLVDADLRRPKTHSILDLETSPGLAEHLEGLSEFPDVVRKTPYFGLSVVTAGDGRGHPGELLASPEFQDFVSTCRSRFDYVLFDTPPLHPISDVKFLAEFVDGILIVVRANRTSRKILKQATENLPPGKIIGTILNRADNVRGGYGYGKGYYYYKYY